jgi:hypothetical protein
MLTRAIPVPNWTERGNPEDAHEEEGRQEKEEVAGRLSEAGGHLRSPFFRELTANRSPADHSC